MLIFAFILGANVVYWMLRPNQSAINENLNFKTYPFIADGKHNSNTDMVYWNNSFYIIHASAPYHMGSEETQLKLWRSATAEEGTWELDRTFSFENADIRDPKFTIIGSRLFIYVLKNIGFMAAPRNTAFTYTEDGENWSDLEDIDGLDGWLFWRPKTNGSGVWYCPAYWYEHGKSILLNSSDGITWNLVSTIHEGDANDETAIEFLPDGRMISTARLEIFADNGIGSNDAGTLISVSEFPYTEWTSVMDQLTRLDGPRLFSTNDRIFALARFQPEKDGLLTQIGGIFSRKRTALYEVTESSLTYISDLPSAGDTSYPGVVINESQIYTCYYSSNVQHDYPWILGMLAATDIIFANFSISDMMAASGDPLEPQISIPWIGYIVTASSLSIGIILAVYVEKKSEIEKQV